MNRLVEYKFVDGVSNLLGMSIVDEPAVDSNFLCFSKNSPLLFSDNEKQIITGVAIRANYIIPRNGYDIVFRPDVIEKIMIASMKEGFKTTINHSYDSDGAYLIESYILREPDCRFPDVDCGSWIVSYKVESEELWEKIKQGLLNGFSIEIMINEYKKQSTIPYIF